jgi:integrase
VALIGRRESAERLGHANIGITLDTYSHVVAGLHEDAAEQVAALFRTPVAIR